MCEGIGGARVRRVDAETAGEMGFISWFSTECGKPPCPVFLTHSQSEAHQSGDIWDASAFSRKDGTRMILPGVRVD